MSQRTGILNLSRFGSFRSLVVVMYHSMSGYSWSVLTGSILTRSANSCSSAIRPSCFYPIPQDAGCITRIIEKAKTPVVYLSTDAAGSETGLFESLIVVNGRVAPLVQWPARNSAEKWDALLRCEPGASLSLFLASMHWKLAHTMICFEPKLPNVRADVSSPFYPSVL